MEAKDSTSAWMKLGAQVNRDWPYSSLHRGVRARMFPVDWGGDAETIGEFGER